MKIKMVIVWLFGLLTAAFSLAVHAEEDNAWFYTWRASVPDSVLAKFLERYPYELMIDSFLSADEAEARLAAGNVIYDLALLPVELVPRLAEMGALAPMDMLKDDLAAAGVPLVSLEDDMPGADRFAVPYVWGSTGLVMNVEEVRKRLPNAPLDSWDLLFDPHNAAALADCGVSVVNAAQEVVAITLKYLGRAPNSFTASDLDAAFETLEQIIPNIASVSDSHYSKLRDGEICLAMVWSNPGIAPMMEGFGPQYRYVIPKEGTSLWVNALVVPAGAKDAGRTQDVLSFLMSPEVSDLLANHGLAALSPHGASETASETQKEIARYMLPAERLDDFFTLDALTGTAKRELDRRWRRLRIGQ